jgi:murein DD-endopeptidase MepM/ murein hydrolase activator NlpD
MAGGSAVSKPILMPGATMGGARYRVEEYTVMPGDSLGTIAEDFNVSIATVLWENNLNLNSVLRLGNILRIPPVTGIMHKVKKGDTIKKIAKLYGAKEDNIITFNRLKEDGSDLVIGEKIMVPDGIKPREQAIARISTNYASVGRVVTPPRSSQSPLASGFVWPSGARTITQYYNWKHHALDIAGLWQSPNYAAKAGVVEISQCGWNRGYGCYILINHGGGVKTLYGHNSKLLVFPGDYVEAGQTIGLMGNTGNVRGVTGIHLHFEIQINGTKVNPLGYIR